jgi:hypothetical protein
LHALFVQVWAKLKPRPPQRLHSNVDVDKERIRGMRKTNGIFCCEDLPQSSQETDGRNKVDGRQGAGCLRRRLCRASSNICVVPLLLLAATLLARRLPIIE